MKLSVDVIFRVLCTHQERIYRGGGSHRSHAPPPWVNRSIISQWQRYNRPQSLSIIGL